MLALLLRAWAGLDAWFEKAVLGSLPTSQQWALNLGLVVVLVTGCQLAGMYPQSAIVFLFLPDLWFSFFLGVRWGVAVLIPVLAVYHSLVHSTPDEVLFAGLCIFGIIVSGNTTLKYRQLDSTLKSLGDQVDVLLDVASRAGSGDLTVTVPAVGQGAAARVADGIRAMLEKLRSLVGQVHGLGIQVATATCQLVAGATRHEGVLVRQAETVVQIRASAMEIASSCNELHRTVRDAKSSGVAAAELAGRSRSGLDRMLGVMLEMSDNSTKLRDKLDVLSEKAGRITEMVTVITTVANRTNLLSLNAAIEAEKAGDMGRGFGVVAKEIRSLSDQAGAATLHIEGSVDEVMAALSAAVLAMNQFTDEMQREAEKIQQLGLLLAECMTQVQFMAKTLSTVSDGVGAQAQAAQEISQAITGLSEDLQVISASAGNARSASELLGESAQAMKLAVEHFRTK